MDGITISAAAQAAIDTLPKGEDGKPLVKPEIRSDNGSGYISREFKSVLKENGLGHHQIKPHCPEENGLMERAHRTLREALEGEALTNLLEAKKVFGQVLRRYNEERLHSALGYLTPWDFYRGNRSSGLQNGVGNWQKRGTGGVKGTWDCGSQHYRMRRRRRLLTTDLDLCLIG